MNPPRHDTLVPMPYDPKAGRRWWQYVTQGRVFCGPKPQGHHLPRTVVLPEHGFVRCNHRDRGPDHRTECGRWVFLFAIRGGKVVVAEVSIDEVKAMESLSTPAEVIEYLGIFEQPETP